MYNAVCTNGYCLCNSRYFYDSTLGLCIIRVGIDHACTTDNQCFTNDLYVSVEQIIIYVEQEDNV
jgi:hypothetical protein